MDRIAVFILFGTFAQTVHADVFYVCNPQRDYIEIADDYYDNLEPVAARAEAITPSDVSLAATTIRRCHPSSGNYVVVFTARRIENRRGGVDDHSLWVAVEIKRESDIVLPGTTMGKCDIPYSQDGICGDAWAAEIHVRGQTGRVQLLRLVNY